jgi:translation initiation factor 2B subunit (eIF-2B alpha/beta/delta family)
MNPNWEERVREIEQDHTSGAAELTRRASGILSDLLEDDGAGWDDLFGAARGLVRAQPEMASIFNLTNSVLHAAGNADSFSYHRDRARRLARHELQTDSAPDIAGHLVPLLRERSRVVTVSNSSTLRRALLLAAERGGSFRLVCAEGRPKYEGRSLAEAMAGAGVAVMLVSDAGVYDRLDDASRVLVGADAIRPESFTNKAGTRALALLARERGIPFHVVAGESKILPASVPRRIREEDPVELWPDAPSGVSVLNVYFEETPLEAVSGVVTEKGILAPGEAAKRASAVEVYPGLWSTDG